MLREALRSPVPQQELDEALGYVTTHANLGAPSPRDRAIALLLIGHGANPLASDAFIEAALQKSGLVSDFLKACARHNHRDARDNSALFLLCNSTPDRLILLSMEEALELAMDPNEVGTLPDGRRLSCAEVMWREDAPVLRSCPRKGDPEFRGHERQTTNLVLGLWRATQLLAENGADLFAPFQKGLPLWDEILRMAASRGIDVVLATSFPQITTLVQDLHLRASVPPAPVAPRSRL